MYGNTSAKSKIKKKAEIQHADCFALLAVRKKTRIYAGVSPVPHLFPRARERRQTAGNKKVLMVTDQHGYMTDFHRLHMRTDEHKFLIAVPFASVSSVICEYLCSIGVNPF
ncbi:MAG: hypothetical protein A3C90_01425 [Candidatus Magasanikbacteria bacterium RIFCSPHIGHO2_02_FULL_51_14]|uniref:Uncharacterized protein n=1 Tax=Candidatus Magasanikbacteria bacterium RIFCSPHIGHO2_02_FULL_51_14 TaxID=1798683 RepID=A0A1F6MHK4_9BACT|nr:MAG: hypothetical protein A3C90_01425 [Candidatus Magasanikbacteria bacterium RIFCSPHIGHO2_02_FULL_51_14]